LLVEQSNPIVEPGFLEGPAGAEVADHALGEFGHPAERGDLDAGVRIERHDSLLVVNCYAAADSSTGCAPLLANSGSIHIGAQEWPSGSSKSRPYIGPPFV